MVLFSTFGYTNSFGVYQALYTLAGTSSASNISWIGSLQVSIHYSIMRLASADMVVVILYVLNWATCWPAF